MVRGIWATVGRKEGIQEHCVREAKPTKERPMNMATTEIGNRTLDPPKREIKPQPPQADMAHCHASLNILPKDFRSNSHASFLFMNIWTRL